MKIEKIKVNNFIINIESVTPTEEYHFILTQAIYDAIYPLPEEQTWVVYVSSKDNKVICLNEGTIHAIPYIKLFASQKEAEYFAKEVSDFLIANDTNPILCPFIDAPSNGLSNGIYKEMLLEERSV